jgi:hypothetical protein
LVYLSASLFPNSCIILFWGILFSSNETITYYNCSLNGSVSTVTG